MPAWQAAFPGKFDNEVKGEEREGGNKSAIEGMREHASKVGRETRRDACPGAKKCKGASKKGASRYGEY